MTGIYANQVKEGGGSKASSFSPMYREEKLDRGIVMTPSSW
jgi:hypothetical protein